jgi:hypothetical protein
MNIQTFIFNWRGQYNNTLTKIDQFKKIGINPVIINSDDDCESLSDWHNIGEESYFTAQMLKALDLFTGDILFHIQADVSYDKWDKLMEDALKYYDKYEWGIYAPNVDYTWYSSDRTDIQRLQIPDTNLKMVADTDCTCWFIHKSVIETAKARNINFAPYKMGWSFDIVYSAVSYMDKKPVLRDYNHTVSHPKGTKYNTDIAENEMRTLYSNLPKDIQEAFYYIKSDKEQLAKYY